MEKFQSITEIFRLHFISLKMTNSNNISFNFLMILSQKKYQKRDCDKMTGLLEIRQFYIETLSFFIVLPKNLD